MSNFTRRLSREFRLTALKEELIVWCCLSPFCLHLDIKMSLKLMSNFNVSIDMLTNLWCIDEDLDNLLVYYSSL
jgi:hypothetical protein